MRLREAGAIHLSHREDENALCRLSAHVHCNSRARAHTYIHRLLMKFKKGKVKVLERARSARRTDRQERLFLERRCLELRRFSRASHRRSHLNKALRARGASDINFTRALISFLERARHLCSLYYARCAQRRNVSEVRYDSRVLVCRNMSSCEFLKSFADY